MMPNEDIIRSANFPGHYEIKEFHVKHIRSMRLWQADMNTIAAYDDFDTIISEYASRFFSFTVFDGEKPILCYLFFPLWHGNWEVTVFKDADYVTKKPVEMTKCSKNMIKFISSMTFVRRLQITVRNDNPRAVRWAKTIGFTREAFLRSYASDGCDCHIFARLNHGFHSTGIGSRR